MNIKSVKNAFVGLVLSISGLANAGLITEYDFHNATGTSEGSSNTQSGFLASSLTLTNAQNNVNAFDSHFYHTGWDTTKNINKYYSFNLSNNTDNFSIDRMTFSMEDLSGTASNWFLGSSLDNYQSTLASGIFGSSGNGEVVPFDITLNNLVTSNKNIEFRFYVTASNLGERAGFANHLWGAQNHIHEGILQYGYNELSVYGSVTDVPEPSTIAIFALGLMGLASRRFKKQ